MMDGPGHARNLHCHIVELRMKVFHGPVRTLIRMDLCEHHLLRSQVSFVEAPFALAVAVYDAERGGLEKDDEPLKI
jgi:hypothetical protein